MDATSRPEGRERYSPGFAVPREPSLPHPATRWIATAASVLLVVSAATAGVRLSGIGQSFDPSLSQLVPGATERPVTPTAPATPDAPAPTPDGTPQLPGDG